jgi:DNA-directed RNA polymerase specialized sigma24 family protein
MSANAGSISQWFDSLQTGDEAAAQQLWERYYQRLVDLATRKLRGASRHEEAEDAALSAFDSFCRGAAGGRFPQLADRDDLWRLLVVITSRKVGHHTRDASRRKRGRSATFTSGIASQGLGEIISREPTPEFAAQAADQCRRLLQLLGDPELESMAILRLEGHTVEQIARQSGYVPRTIKRKLQIIRSLWAREIES